MNNNNNNNNNITIQKASEILSEWMIKQYDDIDKSMKLLSIVIDICNITNNDGTINNTMILLFNDIINDINIINNNDNNDDIVNCLSLHLNDSHQQGISLSSSSSSSLSSLT